MRRHLLTFVAGSLLLPCLAHAGLVSSSVTTLDPAGANVSTSGNLILAWNANGNAASTPVVNGISFPNAQPSTVTIANFPAMVNEGSTATPTTITMAHYTGDMAEVMGDYVGTNFSTNGTVTLSGLTPGAAYQVQFFHHQDVNNGGQRRMRVIFGSGSLATEYFDAGDNTGYLSTLVFTADGTSQVFTLNPASGARAMLNGIILREAGEMIGVNFPLSRQVIQRKANNTADIPISGAYTGSYSEVEARAVVMAGTGNNGTTTAWSTIDDTLTGGNYSGTLRDVPAGGWYQLEVRPVSGTTKGQITTVTRVGVGDVYLTAGQSNAANRGTPAYSPNVDRFSALNYANAAWTLAADPMPGASVTNQSYTGSPWSRLGEMLVNRDQVPVAIVCMAESGSNVTRWLPASNDLYPRIRTAVQRFPLNGFKGILWHQGETNAQNGDAGAQYQTWLTTVINQSRIDAGWAIPWYVAEASRIGSGLAKEEPIVSGQRAVIYADPQVFAGPVTDNYHQEGKISADTVHFNAAGLADHASQWAEILGGTPPLAPKNPDLESNAALADGGLGTIDTVATNSPSVIGWRALNAANSGVADGSCGYYNPNETSYPEAKDTDPNQGVVPGMSGRHVAFLSDSSANACFLQTRRAQLLAGHTYTMKVAIGVRGNSSVFGGATLELLADGVVIASRSIDRAELDTLHNGNAAGTFTDVTLSYTTGLSVPNGQPVSLRIRKPSGAGTYLDFDNVRLTAAPTPYTSWQIEKFGSVTASADRNADPDGDSLRNVIEYHLGLDPHVQNTTPFLTESEHEGRQWHRYEIPLDSNASHEGLSLWYSFNLSNWFPAASNAENTIVESRDSDQWSLEISTSDHSHAFFQLRAVSEP